MKKIKETITRAYKRLIHLAFDEVTVLTADKIAKEVYVTFKKKNKKEYEDIAADAIEYALLYLWDMRDKYGDNEDFVFTKDVEKRVLEKLTPEKMVEKVLEEYNPVTGYLYERESERKQARLSEGMIAGKNNNDRDFYRKTIETNTNLWYTQSKQYAEDIADNTVIEVWKEVGVKKIRWVTQGDEKVCSECRPLDGKIFDIDKVPPKPHYRCRCLKVPVIVKEKVLTPKGE